MTEKIENREGGVRGGERCRRDEEGERREEEERGGRREERGGERGWQEHQGKR